MNNSETCHSTEWRQLSPIKKIHPNDADKAVVGVWCGRKHVAPHPVSSSFQKCKTLFYRLPSHLLLFSFLFSRSSSDGRRNVDRNSQLRPPCRPVQICVLIDKICLIDYWLGWDGENFLFLFLFSEHKRVWGLVWIVQEVEQLQYWWYKLIDFFFFVKFDIGFILLGVEQICCGLQINLFIIVFVSIWNSW